MNIIYLLTNLNKQEGEKRFYIGSKAECRLEIINSIPTIIDIKTEKPYLGSATDFSMKQDIKNKNTFSASILKIVNKKENLLKEENIKIISANAVENTEYYNTSYAKLGGHSYDHNAVVNYFGEIRKDYNSSKSGISKKDKTARKYGFANIGEFAIWIYKEKLKTLYFTDIAKLLNCERHIPARFIESYNMEKCYKESLNLNDEIKNKVRSLYVNGISFHKISEVLNIEIPTVSLYIGDFNKINERDFIAATRKNKTEKELKIEITKLVLSGKSVKEASKILQINYYTANRYFMKCVRERLESNDL